MPRAYADGLTDLGTQFNAALASGSYGWAALLSFGAGIATSFTPCVYPMIAITVSVFGARQVKSRWEGAALSTAFVGGIVALFVPLGISVALTGGLFGSALGNPLVISAMALLFVFLALGMMGVFQLTLPASVQNRLAQAGGVGYRGAFVLGVVTSIIAAPCVGPVLGALLTWIGTTRNVAFGTIAMTAYALGLGILFWIVGTFAVGLPKSGAWLEYSKSIAGMIMLGVAFYMVRELLPVAIRPAVRETWLMATGAALVIAGLAAGAIHLSFYEITLVRKTRKIGGIVAAFLGSCLLILWMEALPAGTKIVWHEDYAAARALAKRENKPLLVDFGASWCGACKELDRYTFHDPRVVAEAQRFVAVRIDLSPGQDTQVKRDVLSSYNQRGLPLVVMHDTAGDEKQRVTSFIEAPEFLKLMKPVR